MIRAISTGRLDLAYPETGREEKRPIDLVRDYFKDRGLSQGIGIKLHVSPARFVEQAYFNIHLTRNGGVSSDPVFSGVFSAGRASQGIAGWLDGDYFDTVAFPGTGKVDLGELNLDVELFKMLGGLVAPGGSLMISYSMFSKSSKVHRDTKAGLDRGFPPVVTPLGFLLFSAGCGMGFKDWYFAEGGREGPEKLQGFKPSNRQMADEKAEQMIRELQPFISRPHMNDSLMQECVSRAEIVIHELHGPRET